MTIFRIISIVTASLVLAAVGRSADAFAMCETSVSAPGSKFADAEACFEKVDAPTISIAGVLPDVSSVAEHLRSMFFVTDAVKAGCLSRPDHGHGYIFSGLSPPVPT